MADGMNAGCRVTVFSGGCWALGRSRRGGSRSRREQSTGTIVTATKSDIVSENMTTTDSWTKMTLDTPVRKSSGTNTAICVSVEARMADQTSSEPSTAACIRARRCGSSR